MSRDGPRLYLVTPPLAGAGALAKDFAAALEAGDVACVLLRLAARDEAETKKIIRTLSEIATRHDVATVVDGAPAIAARAGADGVHVRGVGTALREALDGLKPERIVGSGGLKQRDDAMRAGEAGVDYVMFGDPAPDGWAPPLDDTVERLAWWAEIFNVPCVGYAAHPEDVGAIVAAGADFVALGGWVWTDERGAAAAVREAQAALAGTGDMPGKMADTPPSSRDAGSRSVAGARRFSAQDLLRVFERIFTGSAARAAL